MGCKSDGDATVPQKEEAFGAAAAVVVVVVAVVDDVDLNRPCKRPLFFSSTVSLPEALSGTIFTTCRINPELGSAIRV